MCKFFGDHVDSFYRKGKEALLDGEICISNNGNLSIQHFPPPSLCHASLKWKVEEEERGTLEFRWTLSASFLYGVGVFLFNPEIGVMCSISISFFLRGNLVYTWDDAFFEFSLHLTWVVFIPGCFKAEAFKTVEGERMTDVIYMQSLEREEGIHRGYSSMKRGNQRFFEWLSKYTMC